MPLVTVEGTVSQVVPAVGVEVSVQSTSITVGSVSGRLISVLAVKANSNPVISKGWLTPLMSVTISLIWEASVAPCSTQRFKPGGTHPDKVAWVCVCAGGPTGTPVAGRAIGGGVC